MTDQSQLFSSDRKFCDGNFLPPPAPSSKPTDFLSHVYNLPTTSNILRKREKSKMFHCETCKTTTNNKYDYKRHIFSSKHQRLCSDNAKCKNMIHSLISGVSGGAAVKSIPPKPTLEICELPDPQKTPIGEIVVHINLNEEDAEHNVIYHPEGHVTDEVTSASGKYACKYCNRPYINRTGLWRHNKKYGTSCMMKMMEVSQAENTEELKNMINTMMLMNEEFKTQMLELYKASASAISATSATTNSMTIVNNTNTNNMTNCYNQTFNLQFFLNEQCKDAMNMKEFVNSIQLDTNDLESVGKLGYVEGMSNILITNLNKTELHKRPVHCSDSKRETLYVKDADEWVQDGPDYEKMKNAVLSVEHKNVQLMGEWAAQHPRCMDSNSNENVKYFKLSKTITDGAKDENISKVIKKIAKNVMIDKTTLISAMTEHNTA